MAKGLPDRRSLPGAGAMLLDCAANGIEGQVLKMASGERTFLLELGETLSWLLGTSLLSVFEAEWLGDVRHSAGDGGRLATAVGYRMEAALAGGGEDTSGLIGALPT